MADLDYFPKNYEDARERFHALSEATPGPKTTESWKIPSNINPNLTVETLLLSPTEKTEKLFVILSGVHGLEAYAGHAVQEMILKEWLPTVDRRRVGFFFVHSLNPYGFQYHRRNTENGVNLNRNFSDDPKLFANKNPESLRLSERFVPKKPVDSETCFLLSQKQLREGKMFFADVSGDAFVKASGLGQFEDEAGLEYGGREMEPQTAKLIAALRGLIPSFKDIVWLDLHTGLGERARLHLLAGDLPGCVHPGLFKELFHPAEDANVYDYTPAEVEGFYATHGATTNLMPALLSPDQRACAVTMEFGTLGHDADAQLDSLNQWMLDHQGGLYGYASPELEKKLRERYLDKFFPKDPVWRQTILATSREFTKRLFTRSGILD